MYQFISIQAASVGTQPREELLDGTHDTLVGSPGARHALGVALVTLGQRVAGELPAGHAAQAEGDCA